MANVFKTKCLVFYKPAFSINRKMVREFGMDMYTLLYLKWITNKDLLYGMWSSRLSVMWQPGQEGRMVENGYMYMYD